MADDDEKPTVRQELVVPGEVLELTRDDIGENETVQVIGVLAPPTGSVPPTIRTPKPPEHTPVQVGGGVIARVIDPHSVIASDDTISFPRSLLGTTRRWEMDGDITPRFIVLIRDAPEGADG